MTRTPARPPTGRDAVRRPAHPPAVGRRARHLAGGRGVAAPGLVGVLPAARRGARRPGRRGPPDLLSLGVTPVLAAQLDDPWLPARAPRVARPVAAAGARARRPDRRRPAPARGAALERRAAGARAETFEPPGGTAGRPRCARWSTPGTVELLGGPATHPVLPLLPEPARRLAADRRPGRRRGPARPATARGSGSRSARSARACRTCSSARGVDHLMVEEATLRAGGAARTASGLGRRPRRRSRPRADRPGVVVAVRLPGRRRTTATSTTSTTGPGFRVLAGDRPDAAGQGALRPRPGRGGRAPRRRGFAAAVRDRLLDRRRRGEQPLAVVAWDTELFGHWWHEGPQFLAHALRMLPEAGVRVATLGRVAAEQRGSRAGGRAAGRVVGARQGPAAVGRPGGRGPGGRPAAVAAELLSAVRPQPAPGAAATARLDAMAREALLLHASDWAFMVSRDSAAGYARDRHAGHLARVPRLLPAGPTAPAGVGRPRTVVVPRTWTRARWTPVLRTTRHAAQAQRAEGGVPPPPRRPPRWPVSRSSLCSSSPQRSRRPR